MKKNKKLVDHTPIAKAKIQQIENSVFDLPSSKKKKENKDRTALNFKGTPKKIELDGVHPFVPIKE